MPNTAIQSRLLNFLKNDKKNVFSIALAIALVPFFTACTQPEAGEKKVETTTAKEVAKPSITEAEVNAAQQAWCAALVKIGTIHTEKGDAKAFAEQVLSTAYDYDNGKVFFKPTLAFGPNTFRNTKEGALAYFVGGNPKFPEDKGFALTPWVKARYDNAGEGNNGIQIYGDIAITMGNVWVTGKDGKEVMVDKTWVFKKGTDGKLR